MNKMTSAILAGIVAAGVAMPAAAAGAPPAPVAIPAPPPGKGQIVFFRSGTIVGMAMGCAVHENNRKVSSLGAGRYFVMVADPGRHEFMVQSEAKDVLALEVEPDETQYASCKIKMGFMAGRPDIRPATEAEFRALKNPKLVDSDDMGPGPGALRPAEIAAALAAPVAPAVTAPAPVPAASVNASAVEAH